MRKVRKEIDARSLNQDNVHRLRRAAITREFIL
jgi:hypothetical protein